MEKLAVEAPGPVAIRRRCPSRSGAKENLDLLKRDRDDGVSRLVVSLDSGKADTILPELDRWTLIRQLNS
jgi:hypothetical protein